MAPTRKASTASSSTSRANHRSVTSNTISIPPPGKYAGDGSPPPCPWRHSIRPIKGLTGRTLCDTHIAFRYIKASRFDGQRRPDCRQPPQCPEEHRAQNCRGQGGLEPECAPPRADRTRAAGSRRGRREFRAVSVGDACDAGASGSLRGATCGGDGAGRLAAPPRRPGRSGALQSTWRLGPRILRALRARDNNALRGDCRPRFLSRTRAVGATAGGGSQKNTILRNKPNFRPADSIAIPSPQPRCCR